MHPDTRRYNEAQAPTDREICELLAREIDRNLPEAENKIWHAHPVWFLDGNPIVGFSKLKTCVRLLFWSGQSFEEEGLKEEGSFKAAEARYRVFRKQEYVENAVRAAVSFLGERETPSNGRFRHSMPAGLH
jgi:hypothetical protein